MSELLLPGQQPGAQREPTEEELQAYAARQNQAKHEAIATGIFIRQIGGRGDKVPPEKVKELSTLAINAALIHMQNMGLIGVSVNKGTGPEEG